MFFPATINPHADAERYFDALADAHEFQEHEDCVESVRLCQEFVSAAVFGEEEPLENSSVGCALYEVNCQQPEIMDKIFYRAAELEDPVLKALLVEMGDAWAEIKMREAAKRGA